MEALFPVIRVHVQLRRRNSTKCFEEMRIDQFTFALFVCIYHCKCKSCGGVEGGGGSDSSIGQKSSCKEYAPHTAKYILGAYSSQYPIVVFLILPIVFHVYFILVNIISNSCFHGTVLKPLANSQRCELFKLSTRRRPCTMLHDASCLWINGRVRCQHRIFRMNAGRCMVS